jgi:cytochrome P450
VTAKWLIINDIAGNRTSTIHRLHQQYGSVVRIAPQELSFASSSAIKEIYGSHTAFAKAAVYETLSTEPIGIFSMTDKASAATRRRLLSPVFSQTNLLNCEPLLREQIDNLLDVVRRSSGRPLDMWLFFRLISFDISGK